jgi:hypothetical protein
MKKIKITIQKDGTQTIEVLGAQGEGCVEFTAELEKRLGTPDEARVLKPEFNEDESETETQREQQRE